MDEMFDSLHSASLTTDIRILVVERSTDIQDRLQKILTVALEMKVVGVTASSAQAAQMVSELEPNVVLMDMVVDDLDRILDAKKIQENSPQVGVILVMENGRPSDGQAVAMMDGGVRDCLHTHFSLDDLASSIRNCYLLHQT